MRRYLTEFIGTFFLVLTVCVSVNTAAPLAPLAIGAVLAAMIFAGAHISGGHYNPAVSLAAAIRGVLPMSDLGLYWLAQLVGGLLAAGVSRFVVDGHAPTTTVHGVREILVALVVELLFTFALAYVVLNVATSRDHTNNSFYGLAIGLTVMAGVVTVGGFSGGAFNPAVGLGVIVAGLKGWSMLWIYLVACLAGGVAAGYAFRALSPSDVDRPEEGGAAESAPAPRQSRAKAR